MGDGNNKATTGSKLQGKTYVQPNNGLITWDSEGNEGGPYHSRKLHVPSDNSGLTIGRGYDIKGRLTAKIVADLTTVGVSKEDAKTISKAVGLSGKAARKFITDNKLEDFELTEAQQKELFELTYPAYAADTKRLATKKDVTDKYGTTDWDKLHPTIKEILVDMNYRGDYGPGGRTKIQSFIVKNDLEGLAKHIGTRENWKAVPEDRFNRRKELLEKAVAEKKKQDQLKAMMTPKPLVTPTPVAPQRLNVIRP